MSEIPDFGTDEQTPPGAAEDDFEIPDFGAPESGPEHHAPVKSPGAHMQRADPYWDNLWTAGSQATWSTVEETDAWQAEGVAVDRARAEDRLRGHASPAMVPLLSLLDSWGAVTAEQAEAFTGEPSLLKMSSSAVSSCFSARLLSIGRLSNTFRAVTTAPRSAIYQGRDIRHRLRSVAGRQWTSAEYLQVDAGGSGVRATGRYDRHNVLAAELALRAAESVDEVAMVLGERWASTDSMFPQRSGRSSALGRKSHQMPSRGDGVLVLSNGMRIVLEVTTSASSESHISEKVRAWAKVITDHPMRTSGLVVLFVTAPPPHRMREDGRDPFARSYLGAIGRTLESRFPSRSADSPAHRIGVASWTNFFPARHELSEAFAELVAHFPTGTRSLTSQTLRMDPDAAQAPVRFGPLLAATPHWLRRGDHTDLVTLPSEFSGIGPVDPESHLRGRGAVTNVKPPPRLRVEPPEIPTR